MTQDIITAYAKMIQLSSELQKVNVENTPTKANGILTRPKNKQINTDVNEEQPAVRVARYFAEIRNQRINNNGTA